MRFVNACWKLSKLLGFVVFIIATFILYSDYIPIEVRLVIKILSIVGLYLLSYKLIKLSCSIKHSLENDPDGIKEGLTVIRSDITEIFDD